MQKSTTQAVALLLAGSVLFSSCASSTVIRSEPSGARLFLNEQYVGTTPYTHTDTDIVGTTVEVRLEKEGYEPLYTRFTRTEELDPGALVGGIFFTIPFLWVLRYKPDRVYTLLPPGEDYYQEAEAPEQLRGPAPTKAERLRELKALLDEGIITAEEFEQEKKKILDEPED